MTTTTEKAVCLAHSNSELEALVPAQAERLLRSLAGKLQESVFCADQDLGQKARGAYRRYVEEAVRQGLAVRPWDELRDGTLLAGLGFALAARRTPQRAKSNPGLAAALKQCWEKLQMLNV
jgi:hypothetical protein